MFPRSTSTATTTMAKDEGDASGGSPANESFVRKVSSRVSGILPTLSRWFAREDNKSVRYRDDDDDEDLNDPMYTPQPPSKKAKYPSATAPAQPNFKYNNFTLSSLSTPSALSEMTPRQPVVFPEPVAGPSGVKSRKLVLGGTREESMSKSKEEGLNGDKESDSGESTSGYSSMARIGSREQVGRKADEARGGNEGSANGSLLFINTSPHVEEERTRSLFHDRSLTPRSNSSMSSRRPSFNASTFASPTMTTFIDRTLSTRRVLDSPFYRGRTTYGGASAQGKKLGRSLQGSVQVKVKNEGGNGCVGLSRTARRILDTLEQYSTPVSDAKKIPVVKRREGVFEKYTGANPYGKVASNRELHVPTVPELLKMKQQLQESTEAVRQIATTSKSDLNREEYQIPSIEEESKKHTNKIKTKVCAVRQKPEETINLEQVKLPAVSLPISTLPKFDFSVPPPVSLSKTAAKPATPKEKTEFEFANPHVIAENLVSIVSTNSFKFSEPISRKQTINNFKIGDMGAFKPKRVQRNNGEIQPAVELITTGSVMDVLGKKNESLAAKFKPAEGSWECKTCFVRNQSSIDKCVACESRKVSDEVKKSPLIDKFKPVEGTWECTTCLIRNRASVDKCVACESFKVKQTPLIDKFKPQEGSWECTTCLVRNQPNVAKCVACEAPKKSPLIEKFKPAEGSWECTTCLVRNQATVSKCVACESLKPSIQVKNSPLLDKFKPPEGTWECATCLVRNQSTVNKCVACESPKPFGETKNSPLTEKFKSAEGTWECKTCLVRNQSNAIKCVACTSPKPISELKNSPLAEKFKPPEGTWECPVCMIRNQSDLMRCAACESPKTTPPPKAQLKSPQVQTTLPQPLKVSTEVWECEKCFVCNKKDNATCSGCNAPAKLGFGIRFKPDKDSWECSSCMVRNVPGAEKCVACEALSPEVKKRFKAKPTEWDCDKCKTKNAADKTKCCSCGADKAGSGFVFTKYSYGVDRQATSMFTFGIKAANNVQQNSNPSFIFGNMTKPVETTVKPTFSFGIPPANNNDSIQPEKAQPIQPAKPKEPEPSEKQLPNPSFSVNFSTDNSKLILPAQNNIFAKTDVQKPVFQFGNPSEQKPSIPAAGSLPEAPKPFPFGTATKLDESPAKVPSFSFGRKREAPEKGGESDTEKRPTFSFNAGEKTNTFQFGATPSQPSMQNGFSFGSGKTTEGGFSFGSSSQQPPNASTGGFSFSANPPSFNPNLQPNFNFTSSTGQPQYFSAQPSTNGAGLAQRKYKRAVRRANR